ncbi:MAG: hypothetical protein PHC50_01890 [Candidatus Cloacimonetes bacterium]|nr:hypothetical protein [Candidatus Cloacimonadota bacterium]
MPNILSGSSPSPLRRPNEFAIRYLPDIVGVKLHDNSLQNLHDLLLHRGFLVEFDDQGRLCLSDNAKLGRGRSPVYWDDEWISDTALLELMLQQSGLGSIHKDRSIEYNGKDISPRILQHFFHFHRMPRISFCGSEETEITYFFEHAQANLRAPKVHLCILEPFTAFLVKAFSAIGASTLSSCDGHGEENAHIGFVSLPDAIWAFCNVEYAFKALNIKPFWSLSGRLIKIEDLKYNAQNYRHIFQVARFIYDNRLIILDAKARLLRAASPELYLNEDIQYDYLMDEMDMCIKVAFGKHEKKESGL